MKNSLVLIFLAFVLTACSGIQTRRGDQTPRPSDGPFDNQTQVPVDENQVEEDERPQRKKPKMALVLGPGAFKTFAYPSFLKALSQSGVQVDEIVGIEWGALSAAFYASNGKPHEAEWKVFKLKEENVKQSSLFGKGGAKKVSSFRNYLKTNLGSGSMNSTTIPFNCPILRLNSGSVDWGKRGALWRRVEACMASAPNFQPVDDSAPSLLSVNEVAKNLKRKGYEVVILVNVLGNLNTNFTRRDWVARAYWSEVKRHIWQAKNEYTDIIEIDTRKYAPFDFKAKNGLKGVGERAGKKAARKLVSKYNL